MKILRLYPTLPPYPGGVEQHVVRLSNAQRDAGADVRVAFNFGLSTSADDMQVGSGCAIYRLRPRCFRDLVFYTLVAWTQRRSHWRVDVLHVHGDWSAFLFGGILTRVVGARVCVATVHDRLRVGHIWDVLYRGVLSPFDLCYSTGQQDALRLTQLLKKEVLWITSGVHSSFLESADNSAACADGSLCDVVTVANLTRRKRLDVVLQAARLLPEVTFRIIGDGPDRSRLELLIKSHCIRNVKLAGRLGLEEVRSAYLNSKIFLLTSSSEGTPTAVLEAMACGLPIVTSASNDFSQLLHNGRSGFVVESGAAEEFADRIQWLLAHDVERRQMGEANRLRAKAFAWPEISARVTNAIRNIMNKVARRTRAAIP